MLQVCQQIITVSFNMCVYITRQAGGAGITQQRVVFAESYSRYHQTGQFRDLINFDQANSGV